MPAAVSVQQAFRYILKLCKGLNIENPKIIDDVYRYVPEDDWYIPLSQIIYVGDGDSDMPVFAYLKEHDGLAIAFFQGQPTTDWEGYADMHDGRRVQNLALSDYRQAHCPAPSKPRREIFKPEQGIQHFFLSLKVDKNVCSMVLYLVNSGMKPGNIRLRSLCFIDSWIGCTLISTIIYLTVPISQNKRCGFWEKTKTTSSLKSESLLLPGGV